MSATTIYVLIKHNQAGDKEKCYTNFMVDGQQALFDVNLARIMKLQDEMSKLYPYNTYFIKSVDINDLVV